MHLKRLELAGFKTFADRTALEFSPRITAIVGPNGSGKSNLFDAIRWALGEGSLRALRGVRNEDVIFAGTERRKPLGMAEVTLTLDNTEGTLMLPPAPDGGAAPAPLAFAEVTVARRALRGADSQYLINTLPCRLRDIQTMFLGTGLGGHSYALITQGEVEHMLDATPEERRMILEEAAGLAKYKRRRHDAERRMAAAGQLLLRVTDILGEQEAHVARLAAQAEAAQQYQAYTQELRRCELALQVDEVRRLVRARRRVRDQLDQAAARRRELEEALHRLEEERDALDRRAADAGREWDEAQRALVRLAEGRAAEEASVRLLEERRRGVQGQRDRIARELDRYRAEHEALRGDRAAMDGAAAALATEHDRVQAAAAEAEAELVRLEAAAAQAEERLDAGRNEARMVAEACARAHNELAAAEARAAAHRDRLAALDGRLRHLAGQRTAVESRRGDPAGALERITADLAEGRKSLAALRAEHEQQSASREALLARLRQVEIERETAQLHLRYLEDAHAQYRGYDAGARTLLLARQRDPERFAAVRGAVAEWLSVPRELRTAVEAALGPSLSALVVDTVDDVRAIRGSLGEQAGEAVTFLPLSLVRAREAMPLPQPAVSDPAVRGRALDIVRAVGEHADVARALLADVLIVEDLEAALRMRAAGYAGRIATAAGECLTPEGVLTTGRRVGDHGAVVGRADEIADGRAALTRIEAAARAQAGRVDTAAARLHELEAAVAGAEAGLAGISESRADTVRRLTLLDAEVARIDEEAAALAAERQPAEREAAAQETLRDGLRLQVDALDARAAALDAEASALTAFLRDQAGAARGARDRITRVKVALTELAGKRASLQVRMDDADRTLARTAGRRDELASEARQLDTEEAGLADEEAALRGRCEALVRETAQREQALGALDADRAAVAARRAGVEAQHRETAARAASLAEDTHRVELRQAQVEAEIGSARRRIEEEFGRAVERAVEDVPEPLDRDETLGRIESLRGLIAALGPVNLIAIEEHRQAAGRAAALRAQFEDVQGALAALRELIAHLEGVIRNRFDETFRAVNDEFAALFVRLFGGGRAGLDRVAVEGSDEPGIDITVQPPGKTLRSLGALSGGERVMVALALIFAMLRVRPSPFCVFDEVEAALDEPNTRNVAQVLQELAERTQIIIITHNKATMEACDVLFGVTMEEPGISRMVSMRLQDRSRLHEGQPVG